MKRSSIPDSATTSDIGGLHTGQKNQPSDPNIDKLNMNKIMDHEIEIQLSADLSGAVQANVKAKIKPEEILVQQIEIAAIINSFHITKAE